MNISSGLPSGSTTADYNRLVSTKVEFIKVDKLPTSYIKSYPYIYILLDGSKAIGMYEYNENSKSWIRYDSDSESGIKPITQAEYDRLSDEEKNNGTFYLITDNLVYQRDISLMIGATSSTDGRSGMVPLPIHGDPNRSLRSDGTWKLPDSELSTTSTNSLQNKIVTTELNKKAPLESPVLTGTPKAPTANTGTNNTQIANTSFVQTSVSSHNSSNTSHSDIRNLISELTKRFNTLANESLGVGNVTISADGNTFTQTFSDGRVTTLTKTSTGFREIRKDASRNVISDITTTVSDNGTITSTKTS